jgi:hypothetical protein
MWEHVVDREEAAVWTERSEEVRPVARVRRSFCVEEDEVPAAVARLLQGACRVFGSQLRGESGGDQVGPGHFGAFRFDLHAYDFAPGCLGGVSEPDRGVAVGGADLEDAARPHRPNQEGEQLGRFGLDVSESQPAIGLGGVVRPGDFEDLFG